MVLGSVDALVYLGFKYERGVGVKLDMKKAMQLYRLATDRGHAGAAYDVARQLSKARASGESSVDPMPYYLLAARKGHTSAEYVCGMCMSELRKIWKKPNAGTRAPLPRA